jgi:hypothetical protein
MADIFEYMNITPPEVAREANPKGARNTIRKEVREYAAFLRSVKETAKALNMAETVKEIGEKTAFVCKWMLVFGMENEN